MTVPQLYSLGGAAMDAAFYADCPLSKNALAQALNTSRPTIWRHEGIAYWKVPGFKEDYPELPKELWKAKGCSRDREVPLSPYQSWVVSLVKECYAHLRKKSAVESFILQNQYLFTRGNYQNQLAKLARMSAA
jgi:hypothetical protein